VWTEGGRDTDRKNKCKKSERQRLRSKRERETHDRDGNKQALRQTETQRDGNTEIQKN
jgi:hypothetical protein